MGAGRPDNFLQQLRERGVFRVAASYAVISWLLLQIADVTLEPLGAPPWSLRLLITLLLVGFPVAVGLAWFLELTSAGVELDTSPDRVVRPGVSGARRYADVVVIAMLSLTVVYLLLRDSEWIVNSSRPEESVAILPFTSRGHQQTDEYIAVGLSEDIRDRLARVGRLRVIASTSSSGFSENSLDVRQIADKLGVGAVLNGEVRFVASRLQISMQLSSGNDGRVLWSTTLDYERSRLPDMPGEITRELIAVLLPDSGAAGSPGSLGTAEVSAQEFYLLAKYLEGPYSTRRGPQTERVRELYSQTVAADTEFAAAHAALGRAELVLNQQLAQSDPERLDGLVLPHLDRALQLDPAQSDAYVTKGMLRRWTARPGGEVFYRLATEVGPNNALAFHNLGNWKYAAGQYDHAFELLSRARQLDPMSRITHVLLFETLLALGRDTGLQPAAVRAATLFPEDPELVVLSCLMFRDTGAADETLACLLELQARFPAATNIAWAIASECDDLGLDECRLTQLKLIADAGEHMAVLELALHRDDKEAVKKILAEESDISGPFANRLAASAVRAGLWDDAWRLLSASGIEASLNDEGLIFQSSTEGLFALVIIEQHRGMNVEAGRHLDFLLNWTARSVQSGARAWWHMANRAEALALAGRREEALMMFAEAIDAFGLPCSTDYLEYLGTAKHFDSLREDVRFTGFISTVTQMQHDLRKRLPATLARHNVAIPALAR